MSNYYNILEITNDATEEYDRSTLNTTNENKNDENYDQYEEDYINFIKCQNIDFCMLQNIEEFEKITNNNSEFIMEEGDQEYEYEQPLIKRTKYHTNRKLMLLQQNIIFQAKVAENEDLSIK